MTEYRVIDSPIGRLLLAGQGETLSVLHMQDAPRSQGRAIPAGWTQNDAAFAAARRQLGEYFAGARRRFELPLEPAGTEFELTVWAALQEIPYGETVSYGELAARIGHPDAARAVGVANARNPIALIIPCHRVIGADGSLTGYGGGLERKRLLLDLEAGVQALPV